MSAGGTRLALLPRLCHYGVADLKIRFLLHNLFTPGGGVVTVTLGLAEALAEHHDVELVSLFGTGRPPVHRFPEGVPVRTLISKQEEQLTAAERRAAQRPRAPTPRKASHDCGSTRPWSTSGSMPS